MLLKTLAQVPGKTSKGNRLSSVWNWHTIVENYAKRGYTAHKAGDLHAWPSPSALGHILHMPALRNSFMGDYERARIHTYGAWAGGSNLLTR